MIFTPQPTHQTFCPSVCTCDDQKLTVSCKGSIGVNRLPHTLNPSLRKLTLNDGQTSQLAGLDDYPRLEFLDLAFNKLTSVDADELGKDASLQHLNTSHNQINELKDSQVAKSLSSLRTHSIGTEDTNTDVMKSMKRLPKINIIEINLSHNNLSTIRNLTFFRWHKLQRLDLSNNVITFLESYSLYGLIKLEHLDLRGNHLKKVPSYALQSTTRSVYSAQPKQSPASDLLTLDLSENDIETIESDSFDMLDRLQKLYLASCSIQTIHERSFSNLHTLLALNLDHNKLKEVPSSSFSRLGVLEILKLNNNNISIVHPNAFIDLTYLTELELRNQSFETIPANAFKGLDALQRLDLSLNTNMRNIEQGAFQDLTKLTHLNLSYSSLPHILNEFTPDSRIKLDLRNNPLRCGCELRWLTKWLQNLNETIAQTKDKRNQSSDGVQPNSSYASTTNGTPHHPIDQNVYLTCTGPKALVGKLIAELPIKKLECLDPTSNLNIQIGFGILLLFLLVLVTVCTVNFCRNKNYFLVVLKTNLAPNHISMVMPYKPNPATRDEINSYDLRKETQFLDNGDYEPVDYSQPIYTVGDNRTDQFLYYSRRPT